MSANSRLGILDWGIGAIGIYKLIKERSGDVSVIYFSDAGATPYGKMGRPELVSRLNAVIGFLSSKGVTHLVIGCNAASTAIPFLDSKGVQIEGMIESAVSLTAGSKPKRLGLIGGRRTVLSGVYRKAFAARNINIQQRVAQPLSGLIESGDTSSEKLRRECRQILSPLKGCSHILLACTHYPAILPLLRSLVPADTIFIDPAAAVVDRVSNWKIAAGTNDVFLTSGDAEKMETAAAAAFGIRIICRKAKHDPLRFEYTD
ncbi:MAG: aspartate/glutamate racemase family protein [Acidobacteriota bacterium]